MRAIATNDADKSIFSSIGAAHRHQQ